MRKTQGIREARPFHTMCKPAGPDCNLRCRYCFYTEKKALFGSNTRFRMTYDVLEAYVRKYIEAEPAPEVNFGWQGGEPTLVGLDFFRKPVSLQKRFSKGKKITDSLQTNGTLLDDEWCQFLAQEDFLVGLSIDGPPRLHKLYRVDRGGNPTFDRVMAAMRRLQCRAGIHWLDELKAETDAKIVCAADFMGRECRFLEATRSWLYNRFPVRSGWHEAYGRGSETTREFRNVDLFSISTRAEKRQSDHISLLKRVLSQIILIFMNAALFQFAPSNKSELTNFLYIKQTADRCHPFWTNRFSFFRMVWQAGRIFCSAVYRPDSCRPAVQPQYLCLRPLFTSP